MGLRVIKRDGREVPYEIAKIEKSIMSAMNSMDVELKDDLLPLVEERVKALGEKIIDIELIQDIIEESLMDLGYNSVAKAYIIHREKRRRKRELRERLEIVDDLKLGLNAATLLKTRYLMKDATGEVIETPSEMFRRVAKAIAEADRNYDKDADIEAVEELFYRVMTDMKFLPNSPALYSAGRGNGTLAACFLIEPEDSLEDIFEKVKQTAIITKLGGGVGINFSRLRPKNDVVGSTGGVCSGPVSFMSVFDSTIDVCKQGSFRRGALMGTLSVHSPDIMEFISSKQSKDGLKNFNISVLITEDFMRAYYDDEHYDLINPRTGEVVKTMPARTVMNQLVYVAHSTGDPGLVFIDEMNDKHPIRDLEIRGVNVCGEIPMAPYESCLLGAINLSKFVENEKVDYKGLKQTVELAVHFLDNMLDINRFPLPQIAEETKKSRKIGVGIMGWAEMLIKMNISYESKEALELAEKVMSFISRESHIASRDLGMVRGNFPLFKNYKKRYSAMRNGVVNTIAPTGSRSIIAGTSSGIEPLYAIAQTRVTAEGIRMPDINKLFIEKAKEFGIWDESLKYLVAKEGCIGEIESIPKELRDLFKTAH